MPTRFINPLLLLLVTASRGHLAKQIQYLKAENEVLRARLPEHIRTTPTERAKLLKFGKPLGSAIQDLITIVHPRTFARWVARKAGLVQPGDLNYAQNSDDDLFVQRANINLVPSLRTETGGSRVFGR